MINIPTFRMPRNENRIGRYEKEVMETREKPRKLSPEDKRQIVGALIVAGATATALAVLAALGRSAEGHDSDRHSPIIRDEMPSAHHNSVYDGEGKHTFDQIIWEDLAKTHNDLDGTLIVRDWRLLKKNSQVPAKNYKTGKYESTWLEDNHIRRVVADTRKRTWTQYDPELENRRILPTDMRRGLTKHHCIK